MAGLNYLTMLSTLALQRSNQALGLHESAFERRAGNHERDGNNKAFWETRFESLNLVVSMVQVAVFHVFYCMYIVAAKLSIYDLYIM